MADWSHLSRLSVSEGCLVLGRLLTPPFSQLSRLALGSLDLLWWPLQLNKSTCPCLTQYLPGKPQLGRHMLGTQHLVRLLPVGEAQLVRQREARLWAGSVAAQAARLTDRQLGVAGDRAGPRQVEILHSLLVTSNHFKKGVSNCLRYLGRSEYWEEVGLTESLTDCLTSSGLPDSPQTVVLDTAEPHHGLQGSLAVHCHHLHRYHLSVSKGGNNTISQVDWDIDSQSLTW